jgi:hypothetical protein
LVTVLAIWIIAPLAVRDQIRSNAGTSAPVGPEGQAAHVLSGPGIDPTGDEVSTDGVRDFIKNLDSDGVRVIEVPAGSVIRLDGTIEIPENTIVRGGGELRWTGGIENAAAMSIVGNNVEVSGVTLTNPEELGAPDGERNYGIEIKASDVRIIGNHIELFQNGIAVRHGGEFHNIVIANNRVKDIIGVGGGANSNEGIGEDRGDGIVVWGAQATITGNVVNAKPGTDARVGIHAEDTTVGNEEDAPHSASMVSITGNVVYGTFRRSIVSENITNAVITANTVADATWWGIAVILQSHDNVVNGNTIIYTRTSDDKQGQNYNPMRAPIMVYGGVQRTRISNNSIVAKPDSDARAFIVTQGDGAGGPSDITIDSNTAFNDGGNVPDGVAAVGRAERLTVTDNNLSGFSAVGVSVSDSDQFLISRNRLNGQNAETGVRVASASRTGTIKDNVMAGTREQVNAPDSVVSDANQPTNRPNTENEGD